MKARVRRLLLLLAAAALLLDGGLLLAERLGAASLPEEDTAYFLDVGEGDCTLLVSGGSTVLVDAGTPEGAPALVRELKVSACAVSTPSLRRIPTPTISAVWRRCSARFPCAAFT